jgi:hypothetical protein
VKNNQRRLLRRTGCGLGDPLGKVTTDKAWRIPPDQVDSGGELVGAIAFSGPYRQASQRTSSGLVTSSGLMSIPARHATSTGQRGTGTGPVHRHVSTGAPGWPSIRQVP